MDSDSTSLIRRLLECLQATLEESICPPDASCGGALSAKLDCGRRFIRRLQFPENDNRDVRFDNWLGSRDKNNAVGFAKIAGQYNTIRVCRYVHSNCTSSLVISQKGVLPVKEFMVCQEKCGSVP